MSNVGAYDADVYLSPIGSLPSGGGADYYAFTLAAGDSATLVVAGPGGPGVTLALQDASGTVLATGATGATNFDRAVRNFVASTSGTYFAVVTSAAHSQYNLVVTRNADFDTENNNTSATAQNITGTRGVLGRSSADDDWFTFAVHAGDALTLQTSTPGDGPGEFFNTLNPRLELYDASGALVASGVPLADGRNEQVVHTATLTGNYRARIVAEGVTSGDYVLSVLGVTATPPVFEVAGISPADGALLNFAPTQITVDFYHNVLVSSLQASDLTVDGGAATSFTVIDADTVQFTVSAAGSGTHTVHIAQGAIQDLAGTVIEAFTSHFTVDATPPRIIGSSIQQDDILAPGNLTYTVTFSEPMLVANLDASDFSLVSFGGGSVAATGMSYDATGTVLTISYAGLVEDGYTLRLFSGNGRFEDAVGNDLDGEAVAFPLPPNVSGNGVAGGDFIVQFGVESGSGTVVPITTPLTATAPLGSLVYEGSATSSISFANDVDSYSIHLEAGQTITLVVDPSATLRPTVTLRDRNNNLVGSVPGLVTGQDIVLQSIPLVQSGTYTISVGDAIATTGSFSVQVLMNAVAEPERHGGLTNDTPATAVNLDNRFLDINPANGSQRAAVLGTAEGTDVYSFTLAAGQSTRLILETLGAIPANVALLDSAGNTLLTGAAGATNYDRGTQNFIAPVSGVYFAAVTGTATMPYNLVVMRDADFDTEGNDSFATAQDITDLLGVLGHISSSDDWYSFSMFSGESVRLTTSTPADGPGEPVNTLDPRLELYDPTGGLIVGGAALSDGRNEEIVFTATSSGLYRVHILSDGGTNGEYFLSTSDTWDGTVEALPPEGSLIHDRVINTRISAVGESDDYPIDLDAGQTISVAVSPVAGLHAVIELRDPSNALIGSASAAGAGLDALLQTVPAPVAGTYTISVKGAAGTTGKYQVQVALNVALEDETHDGPANGTRATAQDINGSFLNLGAGMQRGAVLGIANEGLAAETEPNNNINLANDANENFVPINPDLYQLGLKGTISVPADFDFYNLGALQGGDVLTISVSGFASMRGTNNFPIVELYRGTGEPANLVALNSGGGPGNDSLIYRYSVSTTDTYFVRARASSIQLGTYDLGIWLENSGAAPITGGTVTAEAEPNNTWPTATDVSTSWRGAEPVPHSRRDHQRRRGCVSLSVQRG